MARQRLFYVPGNGPIVEVRGRVWRHPNGTQIANPGPSTALKIYPLESDPPPENPEINDFSEEYQLGQDGLVRKIFSYTPKPIGAMYQKRLAELRAYAKTVDTTRPGFDPDNFALHAYAHAGKVLFNRFDDAAYTLAGDTSSYWFLKDDGEWIARTATQVRAFERRLSNDINAVAAQYEIHKAALQALRDATNRIGLVSYDITTGWPT